jgi:membrane protease YdiL (CAAX protease family)
MPANLIVFFVLAYALSWASWLPLMLSGATVVPAALPTHIPGLLGPAVAAFAVAALMGGRSAIDDLVARILRFRFPLRGWIAALAPFGFLVVGVFVHLVINGAWPDFSGLGRYSGIPPFGVAAVLLIVFVSNLGEEVGWRGYALPRLQARYGPRLGTFILYPLWALWHLPSFWFLANFLEMSVFTVVIGWGLGILAGTLVLANVAHLARGSVFAASVWHLGYNAASATDLGSTVPVVATILVVAWAVSLVRREWNRPEVSALAVSPPPEERSEGGGAGAFA